MQGGAALNEHVIRCFSYETNANWILPSNKRYGETKYCVKFNSSQINCYPNSDLSKQYCIKETYELTAKKFFAKNPYHLALVGRCFVLRHFFSLS